MPNRIIREGINSSARINALSPMAELLYRRLMSVVDDYGRYYASASAVKGACWPTHPNPPSDEDVRQMLAECAQSADNCPPLVTLYEVKGCAFLQVNDFKQRTRSDSKFPEPRGHLPADGGHLPARARTSSHSVSDSRIASDADNCPPDSAEIVEPVSRPKAVVVLPPEGSFDPWWELWSGKRGTAYQDRAARAWISVVTGELLAAAMECTASYLASGKCDDGHGWNPDGFIFEMAKTQFIARWPAKMAPKSQRRSTVDVIEDRLKKGEKPW